VHQVGFSLKEYIEMHGQQHIKLYEIYLLHLGFHPVAVVGKHTHYTELTYSYITMNQR